MESAMLAVLIAIPLDIAELVESVAVSVNVSVVAVLDVTKLVILTRFETVAVCVIVTTCVFVPLASFAEVSLVVVGVRQPGEVHHGE